MSQFEQNVQKTLSRHEEPELNKLINTALNRRQFLQAATAGSTIAFFTTTPIAKAVAAQNKNALLGFKPVAASTADTIIVPEGYDYEVLISWGDPVFNGAASFNQNNDSKAQTRQFGDNNDGMTFFQISKDRAILSVNNEYTNYEYLFTHQGKKMTADDVKKAQAAHGVSIIELANMNGNWVVNKNARLNRRITANTKMEITGPAAGHQLLKTTADPTGKNVLGTFNNCANGETPWGTYLTCEENFNGYFGSDSEPALDSNYARYGISAQDAGYQWYKFDKRFDLGENINEPHRFGWVVEIDPVNPYSTPKKRTALGRFKHENATLTLNNDGHVIVYLGDDERGEHLYKFVSKNKYDASKPQANRDLLEDGTLYVAKFEAKEGELKGSGKWIELTWGKNGLTKDNGFADQGEVLIFARKAASQVGATTMDRPEWVAIHPQNQHVFCTLTNNKYRGVKANQPVDAVNPRVKNPYGHIVRWQPSGGDHTSENFEWDLYLIAGNPTVHKEGLMAGSENITADNMFNSPDGIGFDNAGRLWIQTDGKYSNKGDFAGMGNNQMLCGDPVTGEVRRFLTGPIACEITGLAFTPDQKTMFVGVQHPGEALAPSHFPDGGNSIPRSSVIQITRKDGGIIGT